MANRPAKSFRAHSYENTPLQLPQNHTLTKKEGARAASSWHLRLYFVASVLRYFARFPASNISFVRKTMSKPVKDSSRCRHHDQSGRHCRIPRLDTHPAFCYLHARAERLVRDADLRRSKFSTRCGTFQTSTDVNQALGRAFNMLAQGRMQARDAVALAYISQLLLQTLDGVKYETEIAFGSEGYENMVRDIVDPLPPDSPPEVSTAPATSPEITASASHPQTGASAEPRVG
jgi:hypothetical protein